MAPRSGVVGGCRRGKTAGGCGEEGVAVGCRVAGSAVAALARRHRAVARAAGADRDMSRVDGRGRLRRVRADRDPQPEDGARTLTPHQVGARLGYGPIPAGATVLHDCEVRLCCRAAPGHLRVGTQSENMRQAVARGRAVGPRPGRVDVRGKAGASRAIQAALRAATDRSPAELAAVLAAVIAEGDPLRDLHPLFDLPAHPAGTSVSGWRRSRVPPLRAGCWCGRGGGDRSSRYRCSAGSTHRRPLIGCCGHRRGSAPGRRSRQDGWFGPGAWSGPRGVLSDRPGRGGRRPPARSDRTALPERRRRVVGHDRAMTPTNRRRRPEPGRPSRR